MTTAAIGRLAPPTPEELIGRARALCPSLNWDAVGTMYGQHAFGLEPKGQY